MRNKKKKPMPSKTAPHRNHPTPQETLFLKESNLIEKEPSEQAFDDAVSAWSYAKKFVTMDLTTQHVMEMHRILMKRLNPRIAGRLRDCDVFIGGRHCKKESAPKLRAKIDFVVQTINDWRTASPPTGVKKVDDTLREHLAKSLHVRFEEIHPFEDGNGRVGRILLNVHRLKMGLPLLVIDSETRFTDYYPWFDR